MKEQLARQLELHGDLQHDPEYYGRGMSKPTHALIGTQADLMDSIAALVDELISEALALTDDESKDKFQAEYEELNLGSLSGIRVDNIGNELIFY